MKKIDKCLRGLSGRYLYAIVPGSENKTYGTFGINGGTVYTIANGDVSAVVSDVLNQKIRPERRHFAAHQGVLKKLLENCDLLPMSFGIISAGPKAVRGLLSRNQEHICQALERVAGKVEMGLKVAWDVPNIFEYMILTHEDLQETRDRLMEKSRQPSHDEKIAIGQMFEELLNADRDRYTTLVEEVVGPTCFEIKRSKCAEERGIMNLACLVGRDGLSEFEDAVLRAASLFDDSFMFDYTGPWAPHNFVEIEVDI